MAWTELELAYTAGLIDGEGTIAIQYRSRMPGAKKYHNVVLQIGNTDAKMIHWLHEHYGGGFSIHRRNGKSPHSKPLWMWTACGDLLDSILEATLPYLVTKKELAELALLLRGTICKPGEKLSASKVDLRQKISGRMTVLNWRGVA